MTEDPFTPHLDPGERLLWQGRPGAGLVITKLHLFTLMRGVFALGLFVYILSRLNFGLAPYFDIQIIVFVLFFMAVPIDIVKSACLRRVSRYALTNRRALIAADLPLFGLQMASLPINAQTPLDIRPGRVWSILMPGPDRRRLGVAVVPKLAGFERIADGPAVLALIRAHCQGSAP